MVYQSVPSGSFTGSFGIYTTGGNSGNTIWADSTQGPGHLRVTVGPSQTTVDFIRYNGTTPAYSYDMEPTTIVPTPSVTSPSTAGPFSQGSSVSVAWNVAGAPSTGTFHTYAVAGDGTYFWLDSRAATGAELLQLQTGP